MIIVGCSGAQSAENRGAASVPEGDPSERPPTVEPASASEAELTGAAIAQWFEERGGKPPRALEDANARCKTVRAPVPSGAALLCDQEAMIKPWVRVTRKSLFDVRNGNTLILMNLISKVAPMEAAGGPCGGAAVALRIELSSDGEHVTVSEEPECGCSGRAEALLEPVEKLRAEGASDEATSHEYQAREVKAACDELGEYQWEEHGFVPVSK